MRQVPVRELNQHTADVLARVERGERLAITRNGVRVAIIEPAQPDPLRALIDSGDLRPARGPLPLLSEHDETAQDPAGSDSAGLEAAGLEAAGLEAAGLEAVLEDRYGENRW